MTTEASWMLSSRPYQRRGKVGHRGSRLQHSEFTLLSHITIHLTSLPLAPGCSLHHIHCQVEHPGPLFNTPHHSSTLTPAHFDVPVKNGAEDHSAAICFHTNLSTSVSGIWEAGAFLLEHSWEGPIRKWWRWSWHGCAIATTEVHRQGDSQNTQVSHTYPHIL